MPIIVKCHCGKSYQVPDNAAGKQIRCKGCNTLVPVPLADASTANDKASPLVAQPVVDQPVVAQPVVARPVVATPVQQTSANRPSSSASSGDSIFPPLPPSSPMDYSYPAASTAYPQTPMASQASNYGYGQSTRSPKPINANAIVAWIVGGIVLALVLFVALIVGIVYMATPRSNEIARTTPSTTAPRNFNPGQTVTAPLQQGPSGTPSFTNPLAAPRPDFSRTLEGGVKFGSTKCSSPGPGGQTVMNVYLPSGTHANGSLGCVLVAPAGTNLLIGNSVDGADYHAETLPYAKAGYVAIQYSLDGDADTDNPNVSEMQRAFREFRSSNAGLWNVMKAIEFVKAQMPEVNSSRIYLAGHSSAGTVSLLASGRTSVAGCLAYAPCTDPEAFHKPFANEPEVERLFPGYKLFDQVNSPIKMAPTLRVPLFVFQAMDDSVTSVAETRRYVETVKRTNNKVEYVEVASGDHYDSMISQGIPAGIQWLRRVDGAK